MNSIMYNNNLINIVIVFLFFSFLFGNLFVYFLFQGKDQIEQKTRTILYTVFLVPGLIGIVVLLFLPQVNHDDDAILEVASIEMNV